MLMKFRIFVFLCISFLASTSMAFAQDSSAPDGIEKVMAEAARFNQRMEALIEKYKNADAKKDAEAAFSKNDLRLISIMGYSEYTPGVGDENLQIEKYGTFCMPDTGDVILSQKHGEFQRVARDYAKRYNDALLSLIKKAKNESLKLIIKSEKDFYQAGENIILSASLGNMSNHEMIIYWNNDTPVLEADKTGIVVANMPVIRIKDFEILCIKPRETVQRKVVVKSDSLSGDVKLALQYNPMELKIAQKISSGGEVFKGVLVSNLIALRVDQRVSDVLDVECMRALSIGAEYITSSKLPAEDYKLIKAENMVMGSSYIGARIWHLTYKAKDLIERVGKGGEIFIEVNLDTQEAKLLGYGE